MERRAFGRRNFLKHGWLRVSGRPPLACIVRNLSAGGALLELSVPSWLPMHFELRLEPEDQILFCEVRHHHNGWIGVKFLDKPPVEWSNTLTPADEWLGAKR